jgi:hypothetical protein
VKSYQEEDKAATRKAQQESDAQFESKQVGVVLVRVVQATSLTLQRKNIQRTGTAIGLYMPPAVNVQYNMDYSEGEIGVMGEALYGLFKRLSSTEH